MHIKEMISQHRRDFTAIYECEHCKATKKKGGYDDSNFHRNVIPAMECEKCGKKADKKPDQQRATRYADYEVI